MVSKGIVIDSGETKISELRAKSTFGGSQTHFVLTNKRVHLHQREFMGPKTQRTFDLRSVESIDFGSRQNILAWFFLVIGIIAAVSSLFLIAETDGVAVFGIVFWGPIAWLCWVYRTNRHVMVSVSSNRQAIRVYKTPEKDVLEFSQAVMRAKDTLHDVRQTSSTTPVQSGAAQRLQVLADLLKQGLITTQEFEAQRREILTQV